MFLIGFPSSLCGVMSRQELAPFFYERWDGRVREAGHTSAVQCKAIGSHVTPLSRWRGSQKAQCTSQEEEEALCCQSLSESVQELLENCHVLGLMFGLG